MKSTRQLDEVTQGFTLDQIATVLIEEVRAVFGECRLAEEIRDDLLIHLLCSHVCDVKLV
jgi:hypothetical protein